MCLNRTTSGANHNTNPILTIIALSRISTNSRISSIMPPDNINISHDRQGGISRERSSREEISGPPNTKIIQINGRQISSTHQHPLLPNKTTMKRCSMNIQGGLPKQIIRLHNTTSGLNRSRNNQTTPTTGGQIIVLTTNLLLLLSKIIPKSGLPILSSLPRTSNKQITQTSGPQ